MANDKELSALAMIDELRADDLATISRPGVPSMSITVGALAAKLATMIPAATPTSSGVMTAAQAAQVPTDANLYYSERVTYGRFIPFGKKLRVHLDFEKMANVGFSLYQFFVRAKVLFGEYNYADGAMVVKSAALRNNTDGMIATGSLVERLTSPVFVYVSDFQAVMTGVDVHRDIYFDIVPKGVYGASNSVRVWVEMWGGTSHPTTLTTELLDATDAERAMSNADEM